MYMNVESFSNNVGQSWDIHSHIFRDFIFVNISIGLVRTEEMRKEVDRLYLLDKLKYYNATINSTCIEHIIMLQGSLEQEIYARKLLGVLLVAEEDYFLRNKVIKLLRKHYPIVYRSVKKINNKELMIKYLKMDEATQRTERRLDAAVYLYLFIHCSSNQVDQAYILSIINDIKNYESNSPMTTNIDKELEKNKNRIQEIKALVEKEYGKVQDYKDVLNTHNENVDDIGAILENLFMINKIDINQIFDNSDPVNIDKIILAYIKAGYRKKEKNLILQAIVNGIFIQYMINEYKKLKKLYFENNQETMYFKTHSLEQRISSLENENADMKKNLELFYEQKASFDETLKNQINKLNKSHKAEVIQMAKTNEKLRKQLEEEEKYRSELNILREYMFEVKNNYTPSDPDKTLENYIANKKILIIGGAKAWRRKVKERYAEISTLNGFNDNFEINALSSVDYIFFYTGFMSHSTYNRAMSYIRTNGLKFGYIGKTNIDLVEEELVEELQKLEIGRRLNLSD
ncbi:hypothetical protein JMF89_09845 [Clostridiaceae bacterium UIB06]|uniref:DUF2325 domain-containing protein n=1 Tax=Clostridium thailandense TaxID=2794346 RepID=A0A949U001_9CLOT|nr:hypothetical protein [Clostridium thailandense]MBV7273719.1 hypothetical protein [Clostridium thailandense]MCH5137501.1 hypothetical protein [Clostridiaceae bacterium UIB06]